MPEDLEDTITSDKAEDQETKKKPDVVDAGDDYDPLHNEVSFPIMAFYAPPHAKWPMTDHYNLRNPKPTVIRDVCIDTMTEAYATVQVPAQIGSNQCGSLWCKVDTGAEGNVMHLHVLPNSSLSASVQLATDCAYIHQTPIQQPTMVLPSPNVVSLTLPLNGNSKVTTSQIDSTHNGI